MRYDAAISALRAGRAPLLATWAALAWMPAMGATPEDDAVYADARALYLDLHQHPELSGQEVQTAAKLAGRLRALGYEVTEHVGGTGFVALLHNGPGPVVALRTELDALPLEEKTGLAWASHVRAKDSGGAEVGVMHACGHDLHMSALIATATHMARERGAWHGTLMLIGQPAEETISGAEGMLRDGLFTRTPRPDTIAALHIVSTLPAGQVGVLAGPAMSSADSIRITFHGRGGHGSAPHTTVDPVLMGAHAVLALQSIVAREVKPGEFAVVTVGYFHGGTKNNIIADDAELGLTLRSYKPEVRRLLLAAVTRIANAEAQAAGAPRPPTIEHYEQTDAVDNDAALAQRLRPALEAALGRDRVVTPDPGTASEDFSYFTARGIPGFYLMAGSVPPAAYAEAKAAGTAVPSNHSPLFAPDLDLVLHTAIAAELAMLHELLGPAGRRPAH